MTAAPAGTGARRARVLLHSQRSLYANTHFRLGLYEFEDVIREIDSTDLISPEPTRWFARGTRVANRLAYDFKLSVNPGVRRITVTADYDLFFAVVQFPKDLLHVARVDGWKDRCKTSICWLNEMWVRDIARSECFLKILAEFDHVIVHWAGSVEAVQRAIGKPCSYQPYGIEALRFCPYPQTPERVIDVYSIGRRSDRTHASLLKMARDNGLFYVYDTMAGSQVLDPGEHRSLMASLAKRSRYFIVNPGKVDCNDETGGQVEFGNRFFEGAASGTVMIGETPSNAQFRTVFDWPDAVIHLPYDSEAIADVIEELDKDPARLSTIRRNNVVQSLLRHDWTYRWEAVLRIAGLDALPALAARKQRLGDLAALVSDTAVSQFGGAPARRGPFAASGCGTARAASLNT